MLKITLYNKIIILFILKLYKKKKIKISLNRFHKKNIEDIYIYIHIYN